MRTKRLETVVQDGVEYVVIPNGPTKPTASDNQKLYESMEYTLMPKADYLEQERLKKELKGSGNARTARHAKKKATLTGKVGNNAVGLKITSEDVDLMNRAATRMLKQFVDELIYGLIDLDYNSATIMTKRKNQLAIMKETISTIRNLQDFTREVAEKIDDTDLEKDIEQLELMTQAKELLGKFSK